MGWTEPFSYHFNRGLYFHEVRRPCRRLFPRRTRASGPVRLVCSLPPALPPPSNGACGITKTLAHQVWPRLLCGTQPRSPAEVEELATRHGVVAMVNLQQDKDMQHWGWVLGGGVGVGGCWSPKSDHACVWI
jgi:hypothetical protein